VNSVWVCHRECIPFLLRIGKIIDDGDNACWFAGLEGWFDTGVRCLQRRDAWSVHTRGFKRAMCDWAEMRLWLGSLFKVLALGFQREEWGDEGGR
jgi:hypothetical protein